MLAYFKSRDKLKTKEKSPGLSAWAVCICLRREVGVREARGRGGESKREMGEGREQNGVGGGEREHRNRLFFVSFSLFYFGAWYLEFTVEVISNQIAFNPGTMYRLSAWTLVGYGANSLQVEMEDIKLTSIRSTQFLLLQRDSDRKIEARGLKGGAIRTWNKNSELKKKIKLWMRESKVSHDKARGATH